MKTVMIIGANRGIGLEFCRHYKEQGDQVIAVCRTPSPELTELGVKVISGVDVRDVSALQSASSSLKGQAIDLLIHNAGILYNETLDDMNFETVRQQLEVNALGPLESVVTFLPHLKEGSKIALVSSRLGSMSDNTSGAYYGYRMSKAALNAAGKSLAVDLKGRGISVALLHPGYVRTAMTDFQGEIEPKQAVAGMAKCIEKLNLSNSGSFWHSNGELLQW